MGPYEVKLALYIFRLHHVQVTFFVLISAESNFNIDLKFTLRYAHRFHKHDKLGRLHSRIRAPSEGIPSVSIVLRDIIKCLFT